MKNDNLSKDKLLKIINLQTEIVQQGIDLGGIMEFVTDKMLLIVNVDGAGVELIEGNELVYRAASGMAENFLGLRLNIENSLSGQCIKNKKTLLSNNIEEDNRVNKDAARKIGIKSMIVSPLICQDEVVGVLKVLSGKLEFFNQEDIKMINLISGLIAAAIFNALKNDSSELYYKATHDSLTGITNRSLFYDRLRQKILLTSRRVQNFGIILLDIDKLKDINDNFGHRTGDAAIKEVALRIKKLLRQTDTVSRLGGDEFGIIASEVENQENIRTLIQKIDSEIQKTFIFEGNKINLRASIGYSIYPIHSNQIKGLIEKADREMYNMKKLRQ